MNNTAIIVGIVIILAFSIWLVSRKNSYTKEGFGYKGSPFQTSKELDAYYDIPLEGIKNYLVDNKVCHPSCCGDQWPVPFDGLTSGEIEKCIETRGQPGPFVRTNYTCANGLYGAGCPCIDKPTYLFLVNHGSNGDNIEKIEPTFIIRNDIPQPKDYMTPFERLQAKKSYRSAKPLLNDIALQRAPQSLANVQSYGSSLSPKDKQLSNIYPVN